MMITRPSLLLLALGLAAPSVQADFITGRVVDSHGLPVAGVNIIAKETNIGGNGNLANGGTDINGFFNSTIDPGTYRLIFEPPPPPIALGLALRLNDVVVSGVTALGVLTLEPAVALSGRVVRGAYIPVAGVNLDVIDLSNGNNITLPGDLTNLLGRFSIAVPIGEIELRLDTSPLPAPLLAPEKRVFSTTVPSQNIGDIQLLPGFVVSAALLDPFFSGVQGADADAVDQLTGDKRYTPGDNTDNNGFVDFVVPAGLYDFEFCAPFATGLAPRRESSIAVSAATNLGILSLPVGMQISGSVISHLGAPVGGVNVDVKQLVTGLDVLLCGDTANAAGVYTVLVPAGTYDIRFLPPYALPLGSQTLAGVPVNGNTMVNGVLPFCGSGTPSGSGIAGTGGFVPTLTPSGGSLRLGNPNWGVDLGQGRGAARGFVLAGIGATCGSGLRPIFSPGGGAIRLVSGVRVGHFQLDGTPSAPGVGTAHVQLPIPHDAIYAGQFISVKAYIFDSAAPTGRSSSPMLCGVLCP